MNFDNFPDILDINDLKRLLAIGTNKAYDLVKQKGFPAIKIGKKYIIPKEQLKIWLANQFVRHVDEQEDRCKVVLRK